MYVIFMYGNLKIKQLLKWLNHAKNHPNNGLDSRGSGFNSRLELGIFLFSTASDRNWSPPSLLSNGYRDSFPGDKAAVAWSWPITSF